MKAFSNYAQYYDLLNQGKDYKGEVDYIKNIIDEFKPKSKTILDIGCGTGLHALQFAAQGYSVFGIDQSVAMIAVANDRLSRKPELNSSVNFSIGDLRSLNINRKFDVVVALFHVMSYQITNNDLINSIKSVAAHTKKDDLFIFDCWYGPAVLADKPYKRSRTFEDANLLVQRTAIPKMYPSENTVDVNFRISIIDKKANVKDNFTELHKMRYLFEPEMLSLLTEYSFDLIKTEEWMTSKNPSDKTWYVTFICKKK